jgi:hypothetical protein
MKNKTAVSHSMKLLQLIFQEKAYTSPGLRTDIITNSIASSALLMY